MVQVWILSFVLVFFAQNCEAQITSTTINHVSFQIVGIFEEENSTLALAFQETTKHAQYLQRQLNSTIIIPSRSDSYTVWKSLCENRVVRPVAIFGPQNAVTDTAVHEQCALAQIPHIQATWKPYNPHIHVDEEEEVEEVGGETGQNGQEENSEGEEVQKREAEEQENSEETSSEEPPPTYKNILINFLPDVDEVVLTFAQLFKKYYGWDTFAALYEDEFGLLRIQTFLANFTDQHPVTVRRLDPDTDNHNIFKELKQFQTRRFLIDCHVDRILRYIDSANKSHMVNHYQHYAFMSMDTSMVSEKLIQFESNFTWMSFTEEDSMNTLNTRLDKWTPKMTGSPKANQFPLEALILEDVANHIVQAAKTVEQDRGRLGPRSSICSSNGRPWHDGAAMQQAILNTTISGVTGNVQFDENGKRINYILVVNEINMNEQDVIFRLNPDNPDFNVAVEGKKESSIKHKKVFNVISRKAEPYFTEKPECKVRECSENERFEGFSVDLVDAIFKHLQSENKTYTYVFKDAGDKGYGKLDPITNKWDGLIGELLDNNADLAVCDLTITEERKQVVDFSVPFMSLGISILFTKEKEVPPEMFSFLNPYTFEVWMYIATAYCVVSIVMFVCARISPEDWENPQPCDKDPDELENIWNFKNCTWLTMGSIMTQGCDILPKSFGTRWICGVWWFFVVIVCQTYIAQLSASMTSAMESKPIHSVEDLAAQNKILYGAISGGSTVGFFKNSKDKVYKTIYETMEKNDAVYVKTNDEGEKRVLNSRNKYAFFMESSTIEYKLKRNCELQKVGGELDSKDYGIAMPTNSPYRTEINRAILYLREHTTLDIIKKKWWEERNGALNYSCVEDTDDTEGDLEVDHLIGAFLVLLMMIFCAILITAAEFFNEVRNIVVREKVSHKEAFIKEFKASMNFFQEQKPVFRNPSRASSAVPLQEKDREEVLAKRADFIENFMEFEKQPL